MVSLSDSYAPARPVSQIEGKPQSVGGQAETEYLRRLRRLGSEDNVIVNDVRLVGITEAGLKSRPLGKIDLAPQIADELKEAVGHLIFTGDYDPYANQPGLWCQAVVANRNGDAHDGESVEHRQPIVWTENARHLCRLVALLHRHIDLRHVCSIRIFEVKTGGFILPHRDYIEFKDGFTRLHLPIITTNGAVTTEANTAFWMRQGEFWFLESRIPHTAANFGSLPRYHVAIDCNPSIPLAALLVGPIMSATDIALVARRPLPVGRDQLINGLAAMLTQISVRSVLNAATELLFQYEVGAAEVHDLMTAAANSNGNPKVIAKVADLRELLIGTDTV